MPARVYEGDLTVPAGTPATAPATSLVPVLLGVLRKVTLEVPGGHGGLTGWRLVIAGTPVIPYAGQGWLIADHYTDTWELAQEVNPGQVQVAGYNNDIYAHTFYLRLLVDQPGPPPAISVPAAAAAAAGTDLSAITGLSSAGSEPPPPPPPPGPYVPLCYDASGAVVDCASPAAVAGPVTYVPPPETVSGPPPPPHMPAAQKTTLANLMPRILVVALVPSVAVALLVLVALET